MSGEYFDVLKDRLYILAPNDPARRSAQTVLSHLLEELTLMLAPVLVFTTEEVYRHTNSPDKEESVHLLENTTAPSEWTNKTLAEDFKKLLSLREECLKSIQLLRDKGSIGSSLEAYVVVHASPENYEVYHRYIDILAELFIVSKIDIVKDTEESITVKEAIKEQGMQKCGRCWKIKDDVQDDLCASCRAILEELK